MGHHGAGVEGAPHWFKSLTARGPNKTRVCLKQHSCPFQLFSGLHKEDPSMPSKRQGLLFWSQFDRFQEEKSLNKPIPWLPLSPIATSKCLLLSGPDNEGQEDGSEPGFLREICSGLQEAQDPRDMAYGEVILCLAGPAAGRGTAQTHPCQCQKAQPSGRGGCGGTVRGPLEAGV